MGALEFEPAKGPQRSPLEDIRIEALVKLASEILSEREKFVASLKEGHEEEGLLELLSVGMSAGGARAKAVIAWNPETNEIRSGKSRRLRAFSTGYSSSTGSAATGTRSP